MKPWLCFVNLPPPKIGKLTKSNHRMQDGSHPWKKIRCKTFNFDQNSLSVIHCNRFDLYVHFLFVFCIAAYIWQGYKLTVHWNSCVRFAVNGTTRLHKIHTINQLTAYSFVFEKQMKYIHTLITSETSEIHTNNLPRKIFLFFPFFF